MSDQNSERKLKHLFDGGEWNVYDPTVLNLGVGAPGTDLLEPCCDIFQEATAHCLVSIELLLWILEFAIILNDLCDLIVRRKEKKRSTNL